MNLAVVLAVVGADLTPLQLFPEEGREAITAVVVITFVIGLVAIVISHRIRKRIQRLKATEPTTVDRLSPGLVAVSGVARTADEQLDLPRQDGSCLAYELWSRSVVWTEDENGSGGPKTEFRAPQTSSEAVSFRLEDETGSVLVKADEDAILELTTSFSTEEQVHDSPHEVSLASNPVKERKIRVSDLQDGDEVFVLGGARRSADGEFTIAQDDESGELIVSGLDRESLIDRYSSNAPIAMVLGGVTSLAMLGLLVYEYVIA